MQIAYSNIFSMAEGASHLRLKQMFNNVLNDTQDRHAAQPGKY